METITRDGIRGSDLERLDEIVSSANLPSLLMSLFQLTGDEKWLNAPYQPKPPRGMSDNDTAGLNEQLGVDIRHAAKEAITAWARGREIAIPRPDTDTLRRMMAVCAAETEIPDNYADMMAAEMNFVAPADHDDSTDRERQLPPDFKVVVIGAGIGGLLTAHRLQQAGVPFVVLEKRGDVGGTWDSHHYPGAGVDTPSYLYSFSFFHREWEGYFSKQPEVLEYLRAFADRFDLRKYISHGIEVRTLRYDEGRQGWDIEYIDRDGNSGLMRANAVVSSVGLFGTAQLPSLPGSEKFTGLQFHSTQWPSDLDLTGKRVAVVGSGATAMQVVPATVDQANSITIFQKSATWVAPSDEYFKKVPSDVHWMMNHVPFYRDWYRFQLAWTWNDQIYASLIADPAWPHADRSMNKRNDKHREYFTQYIREQLDGRPELLEKAIPNFPPFGKRMLVDNGWYAALKRPHVELLDERLDHLTETGAVGDRGTEREVDVIAYCTGYQASRFLAPMEVYGRGDCPCVRNGMVMTLAPTSASRFLGIPTSS
ncbi:FAD-dependent oxidoreductase [Rhodococcus opacus]|nr:FAD-dependent oxidoreductase [Rhodococcus opacus]